MATNYERGRAFEYRVRAHLYELGAVLVIRSAGSKTKVDLTALFTDRVALVQCKRNGVLPAEEREELIRIARETGVRAYHASAGPKGKGIFLAELKG